MSIQNENDVSIIDSTKEDSINNLFGLTSEVETEIKFCIKNNHKKRKYKSNLISTSILFFNGDRRSILILKLDKSKNYIFQRNLRSF